MIVMVRALSLALLLAAFAGAGAARAETRTLEGETLVLTDTLPNSTIISTDPSLSGHVRVSMDGDLHCLSLTGGATAVVATSGCSDESGTLRIDVPSSMPLTLSMNGDGGLRLGATDAPVILTTTGDGDVAAGRVGRLVLSVHGSSNVTFGAVRGGASLDMTGSGDVRLASLDGGLVLKHEGSGDLAIGHIESASVDLESTGSGDMLFGAGEIASLVAHLQGHGDLAVAARVHDGDVRAYGGGDVKLGQITGTLNRASGDGSDIIVGGPAVVDTIIGQVAKAVGEHRDGTNVVVHSTGGGHFLALILVGIMAYIGWRMIKRRGGVSTLRRAPPSAAPSNPGVVAVCDTMARLEERLGRVEQYVTSREFELQQKFRKL